MADLVAFAASPIAALRQVPSSAEAMGNLTRLAQGPEAVAIGSTIWNTGSEPGPLTRCA